MKTPVLWVRNERGNGYLREGKIDFEYEKTAAVILTQGVRLEPGEVALLDVYSPFSGLCRDIVNAVGMVPRCVKKGKYKLFVVNRVYMNILERRRHR